MKIGILGIQGAYFKHQAILNTLSVNSIIVKYSEQLEDIDGLIIPGGESTAFSKQFGFKLTSKDILEFSKIHSVFGTCAGLIMMAKDLKDEKVSQLGILDVSIERNAYGRQTESFEADISVPGDSNPFRAVFIRAPKIIQSGENINILSKYDGNPVWVENERHMATNFHPEMTEDTRIHRYFINKIGD